MPRIGARRTTRSRIIVVTAVAVAAGSLAGCGHRSGGPAAGATTNRSVGSGGSSTSATVEPTTATTTAASTTTSAPPTTAAPTTAGGPTTCQPAGLQVRRSGESGAAGTEELTFSLTNVAGVTCLLGGYPGLLLLSPSDAGLPTTVVRGGGLAFENVPESEVTLAPGQTAYFNLGYSDVVTGSTACTSAGQMEVTPPNDTSFDVVDLGGTVDACDGGTLHVSPVFPSTDPAGTQTTAPAG